MEIIWRCVCCVLEKEGAIFFVLKDRKKNGFNGKSFVNNNTFVGHCDIFSLFSKGL